MEVPDAQPVYCIKYSDAEMADTLVLALSCRIQ